MLSIVKIPATFLLPAYYDRHGCFLGYWRQAHGFMEQTFVEVLSCQCWLNMLTTTPVSCTFLECYVCCKTMLREFVQHAAPERYAERGLNSFPLCSFSPHVLHHYSFCPIIVAAVIHFQTVFCVRVKESAWSTPKENQKARISLSGWVDLDILWVFSDLRLLSSHWASLPQTHRHPCGPPPWWHHH